MCFAVVIIVLIAGVIISAVSTQMEATSVFLEQTERGDGCVKFTVVQLSSGDFIKKYKYDYDKESGELHIRFYSTIIKPRSSALAGKEIIVYENGVQKIIVEGKTTSRAYEV